MTVLELGTVLNNIHITTTTVMAFRHHAWSKAPDGDYGIYSEDGAVQLSANGTMAEQMIEGTIDYFTRDDTASPRTLIQTALKDAGVFFYLDTIQYENDTGYIHYSWVFRING